MASEVLKLTAQIIMSHASMSELSPTELVEEIKELYNVLAALEGEGVVPETMVTQQGEEAGGGEETIYPSKRHRYL